MSQAHFTHELEIDASPETLHAFLCDLHNYVPLHPLIESIEDLPPSAALPHARRYRVVDRIALGPFRLRARYVAALEPIDAGEVHGHAWQFPAVRLHTVYTLNPSESGTRLVERVTVNAPWLLRRFVTTQASRAHAETLEKLKQLLERKGGPPT